MSGYAGMTNGPICAGSGTDCGLLGRIHDRHCSCATAGSQLIIPRGKVAEIVDALELKPVDKGGNVTLIERGPASLLFRREWTPETWLASPFIMYLDLLNGLGRNKELAQNVRDKLELGTDAS